MWNPGQGTHQSVFMVQMKNWEPLVLGPAFAMDRTPTETGRSEPGCPRRPLTGEPFIRAYSFQHSKDTGV